VADRLAQRVGEQNARLAEAIRRGIEAGAVRALDPDEAATVLWAAWNGIISLAWRPDGLRRDEPELARLLAAASEIVSGGLLA
jgi:TetR/AcrR family transcriptional regulator